MPVRSLEPGVAASGFSTRASLRAGAGGAARSGILAWRAALPFWYVAAGMVLFFLALGRPSLAQTPPPIVSFRFDEDYSGYQDPAKRAGPFAAFKYIPVGSGGASVSLGGEVRERFEFYSPPYLGAPGRAGGGNSYLLQRALLHADLHLTESLRAFVQVADLFAFGQNRNSLGAVQDDRGELTQAFADYTAMAGSGDRVTVRGGRQEMAFGSGRLVSEREGPNLRLAFDGVRAFVVTPDGGRLDAFVVRPVQPLRGTFNDRANPREAFWGAYGTSPVLAVPGLSVDAYYLGRDRSRAVYAEGSSSEQRNTAGVRVFGARGGWDWDTEAAYQFGTFGSAGIQAWTVSSDTGYTAAALAWQPRLGLKLDIASGGGSARQRVLGTFDALYPKVPYLAEAGLVAPANLVDAFPSIRVTPAKGVTLEAGLDVLWRHRTADTVYRPGLSPLPGLAGQGNAYTGNQMQVSAHWMASNNVALNTWFVHFTPGTSLARANGHATDFAASSVSFKF